MFEPETIYAWRLIDISTVCTWMEFCDVNRYNVQLKRQQVFPLRSEKQIRNC